MTRCRVIRNTRNRDGYILRSIDTGQIGFINPEAVGLVQAGQVWLCEVTQQEESYFKAKLVSPIRH